VVVRVRIEFDKYADGSLSKFGEVVKDVEEVLSRKHRIRKYRYEDDWRIIITIKVVE